MPQWSALRLECALRQPASALRLPSMLIDDEWRPLAMPVTTSSIKNLFDLPLHYNVYSALD
ncbi:hypothetical protein OKW30_006763 [Paraburkholderia sp. Clong3]